MAYVTLGVMIALAALVVVSLRRYRALAGGTPPRRAFETTLGLVLGALIVAPFILHCCGAGTPARQALEGALAIVIVGAFIRPARPRRLLLAATLVATLLACAAFSLAAHAPQHTGDPSWARKTGQGQPIARWHTAITGLWDLRGPR
ncbi:MAG: hypothetical protein IPL40_07510 [Proteobacteria bacterium]|nr:hypothetical protein [Pseudomonadota bacterium]